MQGLQKLLKSDLVLLLGFRVFQVLIAIVSIKLLSTNFPEQEMANYYLISALVAYFSFVFISPVGNYLNRHAYELKDAGQLQKFMRKYFLYIGAVSVVSVLVYLVLLNIWGTLASINTAILCVFIFIYINIYTAFSTLVPTFNVFNNRVAFIKYSILYQLLGFILGCISLYYFNSALAWLFCQIVPVFVLFYWIQNDFSKLYYQTQQTKAFDYRDFLKFTLPIAVSTAFFWFMGQGYRFVVEAVSKPEVLASLGLGLGIAASLFATVETLLGQYVGPQFFGGLNTTDKEAILKTWRNYFNSCLYFYLLFLIFLAGNSKFFARLMLAEKYFDVWSIVILGAMVEFFRVTINLVNMLTHAEKKTYKVFLPYFSGSLILAGLLWVGRNELTLMSIARDLVLAHICIFLILGIMTKLTQAGLSFGKYTIHILKCLPFLGLLFVFDKPTYVQSLLMLCVSGIYILLVFVRIKNKRPVITFLEESV